MMVFFIPQDRAGAVELFRQYETHQLVRKDEGGEGPAIVGPLQELLIQPVGAADQEDQLFDTLIGPRLDQLRQPFGAQ